MRSIFLRSWILPVLALLLPALPATAQDQPPAAKEQAAQPAMEDEIIVRGRRDGEPDFQEQYEHHQQEYERLRKIYGPADLPNRRLDRMTDSPNPDAGKSVTRSSQTGVVAGRPSVSPP